VDENVVAAVVSDWTGIPLGRMVKNEIDAVLNLADTLNQRVIGQRHGLDLIARRVKTSRAKLDDPNKPVGVFMLCGPSGVGKTETALALAESLYGGEQNVITINMSEFQEAHTVSTLKGAPPGYVGYGEGGVLTEAVRRRPYSVVLLDEIEKAHPDVHEIFFQVFDKGWMEDGEGAILISATPLLF
jgi:type VI secretion system protein VasG